MGLRLLANPPQAEASTAFHAFLRLRCVLRWRYFCLALRACFSKQSCIGTPEAGVIGDTDCAGRSGA
jgi:hypothetical protein